MAGPVKAIACVSNPSNSAIMKHRIRTRHWNAPRRSWSISVGIDQLEEVLILLVSMARRYRRRAGYFLNGAKAAPDDGAAGI
ncbi:hypothetical protein D3C78_1868190 [compost metagenome]